MCEISQGLNIRMSGNCGIRVCKKMSCVVQKVTFNRGMITDRANFIIIICTETQIYTILKLFNNTIFFLFKEYQIIDFDKSWATVALKLACSWACGVIYLMFLLMPDQCCSPMFSVFMGSDAEPIMVNGNGLRGR